MTSWSKIRSLARYFQDHPNRLAGYVESKKSEKFEKSCNKICLEKFSGKSPESFPENLPIWVNCLASSRVDKNETF